MTLHFKNISIIGLGLIGTSILHALNANKKEEVITYAYDINSKHRDIVSEMKIATLVCDKIHDAIKDADLVILAVPVGSMKSVAVEIAHSLREGTVVTDTGSTKSSVINDVISFIPKNVYFIPSHPLAGTEYSGPESGFSSLFKNRYWLIVQENETDQTKKLATFFEKMGSIVEIVNAEYHDKILAITSHLPHLIAYTIVGTASDLEADLKNDVIKFSASGFRDFTRIAASDPIMWRDIFLNNSDAILEMLQRFNEDLSDLQKAIRKKEGQKLQSFFSRTRSIRKKIIEAGQI